MRQRPWERQNHKLCALPQGHSVAKKREIASVLPL
jgi:hypothetical protein